MFPADMETPTPTSAAVERFTNIRDKLCRRLDAEGPRYGIARAVDLLVLALITYMIALAIIRAERAAEACRDVAGAEPGRPEPGRIAAPGGVAAIAGNAGADRQGAPGRPDSEVRVAATAAVAAAADTPVIDRATPEACIRDEPGARTACARPPRERRPRVQRPVAAIARPVAVLEYGSPVFEARFTKMGLRTWADLRRFRYDIATLADCCRE